MKNEAMISVAKCPEGYFQGCKDCRKILTQGDFAIAIRIQHLGIARHEFLAVSPPLVCCGEVKKVVRLFSSEEEAETAKKEIVERFNADPEYDVPIVSGDSNPELN